MILVDFEMGLCVLGVGMVWLCWKKKKDDDMKKRRGSGVGVPISTNPFHQNPTSTHLALVLFFRS